MSEPFVEQFMADFYAESDEHLATLRRVLLVLDDSGGNAPLDDSYASELHRALHTLKGLSGMVGFGALEQVAHAMEDWFRPVLQRGEPASREKLAVAFAGLQLLERLLNAHRSGTALPDVEDFLARLNESVVTADPAKAPKSKAPRERIEAALAGGSALYRCAFVPSAALTERGVTVERVRTTLQAAGELLEASPRMLPGGVEFHFVVALPAGVEPDIISLEGLTWSEYEPPRASAADPTAIQTTATQTADTRALVRVDLARLDELMRQVGELVISRSRLDDALRRATFGDAAGAWESLRDTNVAMERQLRALREGVTRVRLVPMHETFARLKFAARDLARELDKHVAIELQGDQTEIDKLVVDRILEPLLHLVRNAVSHGLETPTERAAVGKTAEGSLLLRATAAGDRVSIEVADDGRGIDLEVVTRRAHAAGLLGANEHVTEETLLDVICAPGFSTRDAADRASGRGIGMAVVRSTVKELGGELTVHNTPGQGTRFQIELPLTLMIVEALLVSVGPHTLAAPMPAVREILQVEPGALTRFENNEVIAYRTGVLPLLSLRQRFGLSAFAGRAHYVLVIGSEANPIGLMVDKVIGSQEIVIRTIDDPLVAIPGISGAAELSNGRLVLILEPTSFARHARRRTQVTGA
jgi:two-component system, chemotaxis family, sensor kinase CheA